MIESFKRAIEFTPKESSYEIFQIKVNIGLTYQTLAVSKNPKDNLEIAIKMFEEQLNNIGRIEYPIDYAKLKKYLAKACGDIAKFVDPKENYKKRYNYAKMR